MSYRWAVEWQQKNKLDGETAQWMARYFRHPRDPIYTGCSLALFATRQQAREWVWEYYGYIAKRPDLMAEPHGWKTPKIYKVRLELVKL
jgi:hypothetical protein